MHTYYLHLGSNIEDRKAFIAKACDMITKKIGSIIQKSSLYETEPWGKTDQDNFINLALQAQSSKSPEEVIEIIHSIELESGSVKTEKWGPRKIDIDILYCDDIVMDTPELTIPHKHIYHRNFMLIPLLEIAGDYIDPVKKISIDEIYDSCEDTGEVLLCD